jgi:hypothetical protein
MEAKTKKSINSPLIGAFNNIVSLNKSKSSMRSTRDSYNRFLKFMDVEIENINSTKLPKKKDIQKLSTLNVASTFGSAGSLLSSLVSGALDVAGFVGDFFGGKKKGGVKPNPKAGGAIPKGKGIKLGGFRALGVANALFAGLDFATGLAEGESVGKAAAGAGGALAGSLIGGAIGQALIPVPGLGFVVGSMAGNFLGGFLGDRAHESITGEKSLEEKTKKRLKEQEVKQREAAKISRLTLPEVLDKFEQVVYKFENSMQNLNISEETNPYGWDDPGDAAPEPLDYEVPSDGPESIQYGTGNAEFGETGNVSNDAGWVHGHFQGSSPASVVRDTTVVVKALLKQGSPVFLNPGVDLLPGKEYSDSELNSHVERARRSHTHSGSGNSIDVFVRKGTKVPVPLTNVGPTGSDFGGYGQGGIAGYIQGTDTWVGHLSPNSKEGLSNQKGEIKGRPASNIEKLKPQPESMGETITDRVTETRQTQVESQKTQITTPTIKTNFFNTGSRINQSDSGSVESNFMQNPIISSSDVGFGQQIIPVPTQIVLPQQLEQYPDYNQPQSSVTFIPIIPQSNGQSRPIVIAGGSGGGGSQTIILQSVPQGQLLNSLFKTMLLTNLSAT